MLYSSICFLYLVMMKFQNSLSNLSNEKQNELQEIQRGMKRNSLNNEKRKETI